MRRRGEPVPIRAGFGGVECGGVERPACVVQDLPGGLQRRPQVGIRHRLQRRAGFEGEVGRDPDQGDARDRERPTVQQPRT